MFTPLICENTISTAPTSTAVRMPGASSSRTVPVSSASSALISPSSRAASSGPLMPVSTSRASSSRPFAASQRGLCGTNRSPTMRAMIAGISEANIHRQWPPNERR